MKVNKPENENYAAVVIKVPTVIKLEGLDNVRGVPFPGFQAIVSKDTKVGNIGIMFPAGTQLSEEYTAFNNLYRDVKLNKNKEKTGYLEANRRVKAVKFRGQVSNALFMPLESLKFTKVKIEDLEVGDTFDKLANHDICRKFLVKRPVSRVEKNKLKTFTRVESKFMPEHYSTDNFYRNFHTIKPGTLVTVTQKIHGTSIRVGNTIVKRKLKFHENIAKKLGITVKETDFDYIYGSKRVIKDSNNPNQQHYYKDDPWTEAGEKLKGLIPQNFLIYAELIGWTKDGGQIQKNYTYNVAHGQADLYIYRVAFVNGEGLVTDLTWDQVKEFCRDRGLKHVAEMWRGPIEDLTKYTNKTKKIMAIDKYMNINYAEKGFNTVPLAKESVCDEGVCVRVDGLTPYVLKAKSSDFLEHESKMQDQEARDLEEEQEVGTDEI